MHRPNISVILACQDCSQAATACVDACLGEEMVDELVGCVRALLNASDVAQATARVLSRSVTDPALSRVLVTAAGTAIRHARRQCEEHLPIHYHCQVCAHTCLRAEQACRILLATTLLTTTPPATSPPATGPLATSPLDSTR